MSHDKKKLILHKPSTHEVFTCLSYSSKYSKILLAERLEKAYAAFLTWLLEVDFFSSENEKITVKRLAAGFKADSGKITKWIHETYVDIFELNSEKPSLYQNGGIPVSLYMNSYDNLSGFNVSVQAIPREFETIRFPFIKAKMGTEIFWVKKVEHLILNDKPEIEIWLEGGFLNKYREFALDKALFQERIGFMEVFDKHSFDLDDKIRSIYRH